MRTPCLLAAVTFAWFASLQLNDPDPVIWVAVYGGAAVACALVGLRRDVPWALFAFYALACLGWAASLVARVVVSGTTLAEVLDFSRGMMSVGIEEGREAMGLLIVTLWMGAVAVWRWRSAARTLAPSTGR